MPVIRKASTANTVISKRSTTTKKVDTTRTIGVFEELTDVNVPSPQDGHVLVYDSSSDNFILVDPDVVLSQSVEDNDLPDDFITQLESELDLGATQVESVDGGGFI